MKINIREFKNIVKTIIKEEMEKVEEDFGTSVDYKYAKGYGDIEKEPSEDIENPKEKKSLMATFKDMIKKMKNLGFSEKEIKSVIEKS